MNAFQKIGGLKTCKFSYLTDNLKGQQLIIVNKQRLIASELLFNKVNILFLEMKYVIMIN
jgi:hypothetical protein